MHLYQHTDGPTADHEEHPTHYELIIDMSIPLTPDVRALPVPTSVR